MKRKKNIIRIVVIFFLLLPVGISVVSAQGKNTTFKRSRNAVYLEIFGSGGYGSVNYERSFFDRKNFSFAGRIGLSTYHLKDYKNRFNPDIIIPIAVNVYYGRKHHVEIGFGQAISNITVSERPDFTVKRETDLNSIFHIGYRYQKPEGGLVIRGGYTPIIEKNKYYKHWIGVSVGYAF